MRISKKEKKLLSIFGIILTGFIYYQFIYSNIIAVHMESKKAEKEEIENKYNKAIEIINSLDSQKSKLKILNGRVTEESSPLYPVISQEHIILEIDQLLKDNNITGGIQFDEVKSDSVPAFQKSDKKTNLKGSLQNTADEYNSRYGDKKENEASKEDIDSTKEESSESSESSSSNSTDSENTNESKVVYMEGKINFYGTYTNVIEFVKAIEERDKKIALYGISMNINDAQGVKGEIKFGIYSIPKVNDEMSKYLRWVMNNTYGKSEPFQLNQPAGTSIQSDEDKNDFSVSVRSINSELPTVMIGRSNDILRSTYVYADGNNDVESEIEFNQDGDNYYYKYKTSNERFPSKYSGDGIQFKPYGRSIVIDISSESRFKDDDKSGIKLNVINNTDKLIMVNITNDDGNSPRVAVNGDNNLIINKK